jgi:hypothetical protein
MAVEAMPELTAEELDELGRIAVAADPDAPIPDDAVPFGGRTEGAQLLPEWYMPVPQTVRTTRPRAVAAAVLIGALLVVNGAGVCVSYGFPEIAW